MLKSFLLNISSCILHRGKLLDCQADQVISVPQSLALAAMCSTHLLVMVVSSSETGLKALNVVSF